MQRNFFKFTILTITKQILANLGWIWNQNFTEFCRIFVDFEMMANLGYDFAKKSRKLGSKVRRKRKNWVLGSKLRVFFRKKPRLCTVQLPSAPAPNSVCTGLRSPPELIGFRKNWRVSRGILSRTWSRGNRCTSQIPLRKFVLKRRTRLRNVVFDGFEAQFTCQTSVPFFSWLFITSLIERKQRSAEFFSNLASSKIYIFLFSEKLPGRLALLYSDHRLGRRRRASRVPCSLGVTPELGL